MSVTRIYRAVRRIIGGSTDGLVIFCFTVLLVFSARSAKADVFFVFEANVPLTLTVLIKDEQAKRGVIGDGARLGALHQALQDYRKKRIKKAIPVLELEAEKSSFVARILLAHIYRTGKGGVVDHPRAYEFYRQISTEFADGFTFYAHKAPYVAHAFVQLARYMESGIPGSDIKADPYSARVLFEKAAHYGDIEGQYQLGRFLIESGRMRNVRLGQKWLTRAAKRNSAKAQAYLGALYWQGDLVRQRQGLALAWIEFARRNATDSIKSQVDRLYEAVIFDVSEPERARAEYYIAQLRNKYKVRWREDLPVIPAEDPDEQMFLSGIILAEPPVGLAEEQAQARRLEDETPIIPNTGDEGGFDQGRAGFGFQFFDFGGAAGQ